MAKLNQNSSVLAHDLLWRVLEEMHEQKTEEEKAIDQDEAIDLPWEDGQFATGEEDPPWCYEDNGFNGYQSVQEYRIHCPYRTMSFRNILRAGREFSRVMKPDSHYYLWTTKDFLLEALIALRMRGYQFKNMLVWIKTAQSGRPTYGMGHWFRNGVELMLFGTRGQPGRPAMATTQPNYFFAPKPGKILLPNGQISKHSRKPQEAYDLICRNSPGPRVSFFQRGTRPGFYCWGDEANEGLTEEWQGEVGGGVDESLSFGVDWDAGLVDMILNSSEVMALRTLLDMFVEQMDEVPDEVLGVQHKMERIGEVLDLVELENRGELLKLELGGGERVELDPVEELEEGISKERGEESDELIECLPAPLVPGEIDRIAEELQAETEAEAEAEVIAPETTSDSKASPPQNSEIPTTPPDSPAVLQRPYKEGRNWFYDWNESELKVGPFNTLKQADEALSKHKIRVIGAASDEEMDQWFAEMQQTYPKLDRNQVMKLLLGEVEAGLRGGKGG